MSSSSSTSRSLHQSDTERAARWLYAEHHAVSDTSVYPPETLPWDEAPARARAAAMRSAVDLLRRRHELAGAFHQAECQTPGARFATHIGAHGVTIRVELPGTVTIGECDAIRLESNIHDALERIFAPFFTRGVDGVSEHITVDGAPNIELSLIDAVLSTGPWRGLNDYEKATPYRQDQALEVVEAVRAADRGEVVPRSEAEALAEALEVLMRQAKSWLEPSGSYADSAMHKARQAVADYRSRHLKEMP